MSDGGEHRPVVTLAALYGAGGAVVGRRVAERLGVPFLDRQIPAGAARRSGLQEAAVEDVDEVPRSRIRRLADTLGRTAAPSAGTHGGADQLEVEERNIRGAIEGFLARASVSGGVALGRGGMVVLRSVPWALHVHLTGPREARIAQGMEIEQVDEATARDRQRSEDRARRSYVRRAYGVDGMDPALYHLIVDSTALGIDTCVDLIVMAASARVGNPRPSPPV
jgi:cytidylate kinase